MASKVNKNICYDDLELAARILKTLKEALPDSGGVETEKAAKAISKAVKITSRYLKLLLRTP